MACDAIRAIDAHRFPGIMAWPEKNRKTDWYERTEYDFLAQGSGGNRMKNALFAGGAMLLALAMPVSASAQELSVKELAGRFGARATVLDISLSPSGDKVAYLSSDNGTTEILYVVDLNGDAEPRALMSLSEPNSELSYCDWANEIFLICEVVGITKAPGDIPLFFSRIVSVGTDGTEPRMLTSNRSLRAYGYQQDGGTVVALDV